MGRDWVKTWVAWTGLAPTEPTTLDFSNSAADHVEQPAFNFSAVLARGLGARATSGGNPRNLQWRGFGNMHAVPGQGLSR